MSALVVLQKKIAQMAERQKKPFSHTSAIVYVAGSQRQTVGTCPNWERIGAKMVMVPAQAGGVPCVPAGACVVVLAMDA